MPDVFKFEADTDEDPPSTLSSRRFLVTQEDVEYIVEAHGEHDQVAQEAVNSYERFQLGSWRISFEFVPVPDAAIADTQAWFVSISKVPDIPVDLPPRLAEILSEKAPAQGIATVEEEWPFPNSE